jgi:hypothetical protein
MNKRAATRVQTRPRFRVYANALMRLGDQILDERLGLDPWSFGSFAFPPICTCALVVTPSASAQATLGRVCTRDSPLCGTRWP